MNNNDLKDIYNNIFKKGETQHFTKNLEQTSDLPSDEREALTAVVWEGKSVLDVGCGTGLFAYEIAKRGAHVLGIDYSPEAIQLATQYTHDNLEYRCESIIGAPLGKYDVIVSLGTLEHMDEPFTVLQTFKEMLNPGGVIVLTCPNWINPRGLVLMTLFHLYNAPITLADLHHFSPHTFERWAKDLDMQLTWRTFDHDRAAGQSLITDFAKRLPKVVPEANVDNLLSWMEEVIGYEWKGDHIGATGLYVLS